MKPSISIFIVAVARATTLLFILTCVVVATPVVVTASSESSILSLQREEKALLQSRWWKGDYVNNKSVSHCHWPGITCNHAGSVTQICLAGTFYIQSFVGDLSLSSFPNLVHLDLSRVGLNRSIPTEIGNLSKLTHLNLSGNSLYESIPTEIGNLQKLTHLDLSVNSLSGSIPKEIRNLKNLAYLDLHENKLCGPIPDVLIELLSSTAYGNEDLCSNNTAIYGVHPCFQPQQRSNLRIIITISILLSCFSTMGVLLIFQRGVMLIFQRVKRSKRHQPCEGETKNGIYFRYGIMMEKLHTKTSSMQQRTLISDIASEHVVMEASIEHDCLMEKLLP